MKRMGRERTRVEGREGRQHTSAAAGPYALRPSSIIQGIDFRDYKRGDRVLSQGGTTARSSVPILINGLSEAFHEGRKLLASTADQGARSAAASVSHERTWRATTAGSIGTSHENAARTAELRTW